MKKLLSLLVVLGLVVVIGCGGDTSGTGAKPSTKPSTQPSTKPSTEPQPKEKTVTAWAKDATVKQEGSVDIEIQLKKEGGFEGEVTVKVAAESKDSKLTIDPAELKFKSDEDKLKIKVTAAKDSPVGDATLNLTVTADGADKVEGKPVKVTIEKK